MIDTRLNELQGYRTSFIVNAKTVKGEAVLKLDRDCDGQVPAEEPALVLRDSTCAEGWRPVKSVAELSTYLEQTPVRQRGQDLGLWRDRGRFHLFRADGAIQAREVAPIGGPRHSEEGWTLRGGKPVPPYADTLWSTEKYHHCETELHPEKKVPLYTAWYYTQVSPAEVSIGSVETPAGAVATFQEGLKVCHTRVEEVTCYAADGGNLVPMGFRDHEYQGVLDQPE